MSEENQRFREVADLPGEEDGRDEAHPFDPSILEEKPRRRKPEELGSRGHSVEAKPDA